MSLRASSSIAPLLLIALFSSSVRADKWFPAHKKEYFSADRKYRLDVIPKKLEKRSKNNRAKAIFYVLERIGYSKKHEFPLVNELSPVSALVSGDGRYVVTFDNWGNAGHGDDVVVIYRSDGTLIRKLGLEDIFTSADIGTFMRTTSSIWWGTGHYIDDKKEILHLKAGNKERSREVTIDLKTGNPLEPMRDLFPEPQINPK